MKPTTGFWTRPCALFCHISSLCLVSNCGVTKNEYKDPSTKYQARGAFSRLLLVGRCLLVPAAGTPTMVRLPFFIGIPTSARDAFYDFSLLLGEFRPCFHSSFLAARATFSVTHIKLFFHDTLNYLLESISSCNLAMVMRANKLSRPASTYRKR